MTGVKLLHCADLHLDAPFTSLSGHAAAGTRRRELRQTFHRIAALAREEAVDLLLVAGDLFEQDYVRRSTVQMVSDEFEGMGGVSVIMIPGNHDPYVSDSFYRSFSWPSNVHILGERECKLDLEPAGVSIYAEIPQTAPDRDRVNILLLHGTLDMNPGGKVFNPFTSREIDASCADYAALGHFHNCIRAAGARGRIFNPGSPEPLGFDEEGRHGVFIAGIEKTGGENALDVRFIPVNCRNYRNLSVKLEECASDERAAEECAEAFEAGTWEDLYCITLLGTTAPGLRLDGNRIASYLKGRAFYVKIKDKTLPAYDIPSIAAEPGLRGAFAGKMLARAAQAVSGDERERIMQALYFGIEALDHGSVRL